MKILKIIGSVAQLEENTKLNLVIEVRVVLGLIFLNFKWRSV